MRQVAASKNNLRWKGHLEVSSPNSPAQSRLNDTSFIHRALRISSSQLVIVSRDGDPTAFLDPFAALDSFPMKKQNISGKTKATRQIQPRCEEGTSSCLFNQNGSFNRSKYTAHKRSLNIKMLSQLSILLFKRSKHFCRSSAREGMQFPSATPLMAYQLLSLNPCFN